MPKVSVRCKDIMFCQKCHRLYKGKMVKQELGLSRNVYFEACVQIEVSDKMKIEIANYFNEEREMGLAHDKDQYYQELFDTIDTRSEWYEP
jgi:hypothetical protein